MNVGHFKGRGLDEEPSLSESNNHGNKKSIESRFARLSPKGKVVALVIILCVSVIIPSVLIFFFN